MLIRTALITLCLAAAAQAQPDADPFDQSKVALEARPPEGYQGKIVLIIAGKASHPPAMHEFFAGSAILCDLLRQNEGVFPIMARDGWPKDESLFEIADSVVFYCDGREGHPAVQKDRLDRIGALMKKGVGWVNLHYAVDYLPQHGDKVLGWMGGYYDFNISTNPHWVAEFRGLPKHAITRGVQPFTIHDEWYYNMRFVEGLKGVTPILQAVPPDEARKRGPEPVKQAIGKGQLETLAWAYDRPEGGRGFGFTGAHWHRNWADENFRRIIVNAILWSAKADVPEGGAKVDFDPANLNRNLDKKTDAPFKPILPPEKK